MKRMLKALGLGVALATMAAVPGMSQTVLDFPSWQTEDKSFQPWWQAVIAEFEKQHPDVKVQMSMVPFADYIKQMTVRFASNNPPDIVHLPSRNFAAFASNDWLISLDEKLAGTDIPANWSPLQGNMKWNDTTQGVLLMGYGNVLFYNQDLLDKAGPLQRAEQAGQHLVGLGHGKLLAIGGKCALPAKQPAEPTAARQVAPPTEVGVVTAARQHRVCVHELRLIVDRPHALQPLTGTLCQSLLELVVEIVDLDGQLATQIVEQCSRHHRPLIGACAGQRRVQPRPDVLCANQFIE